MSKANAAGNPLEDLILLRTKGSFTKAKVKTHEDSTTARHGPTYRMRCPAHCRGGNIIIAEWENSVMEKETQIIGVKASRRR